jgi:hypothetical protein
LAIFIIQMYAYARWLPDQGDRFLNCWIMPGRRLIQSRSKKKPDKSMKSNQTATKPSLGEIPKR